MLPDILSKMVLILALNGLSHEFCLMRHPHTGKYSLLLSYQPQDVGLVGGSVEDSYVASWVGFMEPFAPEAGVT